MSDGTTKRPAEDHRITGARDLLAEVRADTEPVAGHPHGTWAHHPAYWVGSLTSRLAALLAYIDEKEKQP